MVSSRLLPSLNSSMSRLPFSSLSIILKIFLTRFSGVSSSSGSLTIEPTCKSSALVLARGQTLAVSTYHLVYRSDNTQHLLIADSPVAINVVQLKSPVQLVFHLASAGHGQGAYELFEVDSIVAICIKHPEHIVGKGSRVAKGEELAIDLLKLDFGEGAGGAVFQESWGADGQRDIRRARYKGCE
jgi:hypothetical protein